MNKGKLLVLLALSFVLALVVGVRAEAEQALKARNEGECWYYMNIAHDGAEIARKIGGDNAAVLSYYGKAWTDYNNLRKQLIDQKQAEAQRQEEERKANMVSLGTFQITHYCPCSICNGGYSGTATGAPMTVGETIAVDPSVIPYWTHVVINGHEYIAEDCGGGIKGRHIDVLVSDHATALAKGSYKTEVFMVK